MDGGWRDGEVKARLCLSYVCSVFLRSLSSFISGSQHSSCHRIGAQ